MRDYVGARLDIDYETADKITVLNLKDTYKFIAENVDKHIKGEDMMHPQDFQYYHALLPSMKAVLDYFGEKV